MERMIVLGDPGLVSKINEVVFELVLRSGRPFVWSSLQAHRNVASTKHVDSGIDLTLLVATGVFECGDLEIVGPGTVNVLNKAIFFNPEEAHRVTEHAGDRISVLAFLHPKIKAEERLEKSVLDQLRPSASRPVLMTCHCGRRPPER